MVNQIANQSAVISKKAKSGECKPKKRTDQNIFKRSCKAKTKTAILNFLSPVPLLQTKNKAIPINKKSKVQTGAKIQSAGLKLGFCNVAYQPEIEGEVNKEPTSPAP